MTGNEIITIIVAQMITLGISILGTWKLVMYKVDQNKTGISKLEDKVQVIQGYSHQIDENRRDFDKIDKRVYELENRHIDLKTDIAVINKSIQNLEKDISNLDITIRTLNETMKEYLSNMSQGKKSHKP